MGVPHMNPEVEQPLRPVVYRHEVAGALMLQAKRNRKHASEAESQRLHVQAEALLTVADTLDELAGLFAVDELPAD